MSDHDDAAPPRSAHGYARPLPAVTAEGAPFWAHAREHRLATQRCADCGKQQFPPRHLCGHCGGRTLAWTPVSGKGRVYSFTIVHRPPEPSFASEVPYVVAVVDLAEGGRIMTNVVGCAVGAVRVDMPVEAVFDDVAPDVTLVRFRPAAQA